MQAEMSDAKPATLMQQKNLRMDGSEFWTDVQGVRFVEYDEVAVLVVLRESQQKNCMQSNWSIRSAWKASAFWPAVLHTILTIF